MASRRRITGPHSALTDFLASHNISAAQIAEDAQRRREAALAAQNATESSADASAAAASTSTAGPSRTRSRVESPEAGPSRPVNKRRKLEEQKAVARYKNSKSFQQYRARRQQEAGSDSDLTDEDEDALRMYRQNHAPMPDQLEDCAICDTKFTVTSYTKSGPQGGLLCLKCSRELEREQNKNKKGKAVARGGRRQKQSKILDGEVTLGAKSMMNICIETLVQNVDLAESLGDLPSSLVDKLAASLSKKWLMNPVTLDLFLQPGSKIISVYDCAKLSTNDFIKIFQVVPTVETIRLRNAIQFQNEALRYLTNSTVTLKDFSIHGANLVDDDHWNDYLLQKGKHLQSLKVYYTDGHFGDEQLDLLKNACPNLKRLKVSHNQKVTDVGVKNIAALQSLEHLTLEIYQKTSSLPYIEILNFLGHQLQTFALNTVEYLDDNVLEAIHKNCNRLAKLRLTDNETFTDKGFVNLFTNWSNPPLRYVDFHKCRHLDSAEPMANTGNIGLCSDGFKALMSHSGSTLHYLNIHSCRHVSREALESVFSSDHVYPELREIDVSFVWGINDFVVGSIFRSCPNLQVLKVFGNFQVTQAVEPLVPPGRVLIGVPFALGLEMTGRYHD